MREKNLAQCGPLCPTQSMENLRIHDGTKKSAQHKTFLANRE
jgi:hypothetical protein